MSLLGTVKTGKARQPPRVVVYGQEGIGKSSLAASAAKPIFLPTEDGLGEIDCHQFPLSTSYDDFIERLGSLCAEQHEYETVSVDSLDWLEKLIWGKVCKDASKTNIEDIGYAKGYQFALRYWREVLDGLDHCRSKGMAVILIAHAKVEKFNDPESAAYDRYTLRLHKDADALVREWSDAVLFATRKMRVQTEDLGFNKTRTTAKAIGNDGGERILRCTGSPACIAKNRYGIQGEIPLSWDEFVKNLN